MRVRKGVSVIPGEAETNEVIVMFVRARRSLVMTGSARGIERTGIKDQIGRMTEEKDDKTGGKKFKKIGEENVIFGGALRDIPKNGCEGDQGTNRPLYLLDGGAGVTTSHSEY